MEPNISHHICKDIDLILPCYNPSGDWAQIITERVSRLKEMLPDRNIHLIIVDDGSNVNMGAENQAYIRNQIPDLLIVRHAVNSGKGEAIRTGLKHTHSPYILYTDWDFPYELEGIPAIIRQLENGHDIVIVSRTDSYRHHKELVRGRKIMSVASRILNRWILGLKFNDTQGGLKGISLKGREILLQTRIKRFLFDTEFIYKASKRKDISMCEIKVNVRQGIHLTYMGFKVMRREFLNFIKIIILTDFKWQSKQ